MDSRGGKEGTGNAIRNLGNTVAEKIAENVRRHSLFRRPSIQQAGSIDNLDPDDYETQDTATPMRDSVAAGHGRLSATPDRLSAQMRRSSMRRPSRIPTQHTNERQSTAATLNEEEDLEKIMSLQYTINFDVVFACDYNQKTATLSSIDLMKKEIEEQYKIEESDTAVTSQNVKSPPKRNIFTELRRKKLLEDVWSKQHQFKATYRSLMEEKGQVWLESAENHLANSDSHMALSALEKYSFYIPTQSKTYILKSVAYQQLKDLRMATIAIKMAQELGLTPEEEHKLQIRLAQIEFKQAEKLHNEGEYCKAIDRYQLASSIIHNYKDSLVIIIKLYFKLQETTIALTLLDQQIEEQPERLELRVWRTRQLLEMSKLDICHKHLDMIEKIDPENEELLNMKRELVVRGEKHEQNCIMMMSSNHLKDALQQVELAIGARPRYLPIYLLRAKIFRRLKLWEDALENLEMIRGSGDVALEKEAKQLVISIFNDFGVDCIRVGYYKQAIKLFSSAIQHVKTERKIFLNRGDCYLRLGLLEFALRDYTVALNASFHESTCRLIRGRISVVYHEFGTRVYADAKYDEADQYFSRALQFQVAALYLIHRARVRIMLGNEYLAKADAIAAYELEPDNIDLVPVLARLFPNDAIPAVDEYKNRFFPIENDRNGKGEKKKELDELNKRKNAEKTREIISFSEIRATLMSQDIPKLPSIPSRVSLEQTTPKRGWKTFTTGISS